MSGFVRIPPDACVEIPSPTDRPVDMQERANGWLRFGVRLVWVTDPDTHTVAAHGPGGGVRLYQEHETLPGGEVLPGFELSVHQLFK